MELNSFFGKHQFSAGEEKQLRFGEIEFKVTREKEGWKVLQIDNNDTPDNTGEYFHTGKSNTLLLRPALPEKPLIFKGSHLFISPRQKFTFFIKIPLNIQFYNSRVAEENLFKEFSWRRLSDSWFGEPDAGEPAFSASSNYYPKMEDIDLNTFEAICPIMVFNNSTSPLEVQRLIIRVENLTLYLNAGKMVTSIVEIEYKGKDIVSSADYHYSKLYNGEKQEILAKPRNSSTKNLLKINFHFIKNIYRSE